MLTYAQLIKIKGASRKRFWLVCGPEPALIQDTVELAKDYVYSGVNTVDVETFFGSDVELSDFIEFLERPSFEDRKLAVIYDADKLEFWSHLVDIHKAIDPSTFLIFVSDEVLDSDHVSAPLFVNNRLGRAVKCAKLKDVTVKDWIRSRISISDSALNNLLSKAYDDYEWILNKVRILEQIDPDEITSGLVDGICTDTGVQPFETSLVEFDKQQCFLYIKDMGTENISLDKITMDVHNLALVQTVVGQHKQQIRPLVDKTGLTRAQLDWYMNKISYYDLASSIGCYKTLTQLYTKLTRGDKMAYLALVCGW